MRFILKFFLILFFTVPNSSFAQEDKAIVHEKTLLLVETGRHDLGITYYFEDAEGEEYIIEDYFEDDTVFIGEYDYLKSDFDPEIFNNQEYQVAYKTLDDECFVISMKKVGDN